ncbi:MAG: sigma-70 family RNA polymerase sigma factor [Chloroflexota bacterium]|nr:sigma-70 family RNA polymerase sigma factor [Chloroflexota bacterium]
MHDAAYERASAAARSGDAATACAELMRSAIIDGLTRRLMAQRWWSFEIEEASEVIADAVDDLFESMRKRPRPVANVGGLLWTIVFRRATDRLRTAKLRSRREREFDPDRDVARGAEPGERRDVFDEEVEHQKRLKVALEVARSLLPQLGMAASERVLMYLFDALEQGVDHVDDEEIAEALGSTPEAVRKARERGVNRLERLARERGIADSLEIPGRSTTDDETDVDAEED